MQGSARVVTGQPLSRAVWVRGPACAMAADQGLQEWPAGWWGPVSVPVPWALALELGLLTERLTEHFLIRCLV